MGRVGDHDNLGDDAPGAVRLTADQQRVLAAFADQLLAEEAEAQARQAAIDAHPHGRGEAGIAGGDPLLAEEGPEAVIAARRARVLAELEALDAMEQAGVPAEAAQALSLEGPFVKPPEA